eukprot:768388-Hanusia_phi.AAC.6
MDCEEGIGEPLSLRRNGEGPRDAAPAKLRRACIIGSAGSMLNSPELGRAGSGFLAFTEEAEAHCQ